jgi:cytochrome c oxidase subunit 4
MVQEIDQSLQYSAPHARSAEETKAVRKKIFFVTGVLSVITIAEVIAGIVYAEAHRNEPDAGLWQTIKWLYITLTLIKAGYIVLSFMHLGQERKNLRTTILLPMVLIVYLIAIALFEGEHLLQYFQELIK